MDRLFCAHAFWRFNSLYFLFRVCHKTWVIRSSLLWCHHTLLAYDTFDPRSLFRFFLFLLVWTMVNNFILVYWHEHMCMTINFFRFICYGSTYLGCEEVKRNKKLCSRLGRRSMWCVSHPERLNMGNKSKYIRM